MADPLVYPEGVIPSFRYQFCPMCKAQLIRKLLGDDPVPQVTCPSCGWIANITNLTAAVSVATTDGGIVTIKPPGLPAESPAALPAGLIEYGESPEEAALREIREETGFDAEIVRSLGHFYFPSFDAWPGPLLYFIFEARTVGGHPEGSSEGAVQVYPRDAFPAIINRPRAGSWQAIQEYLAQRDGRQT